MVQDSDFKKIKFYILFFNYLNFEFEAKWKEFEITTWEPEDVLKNFQKYKSYINKPNALKSAGVTSIMF